MICQILIKPVLLVRAQELAGEQGEPPAVVAVSPEAMALGLEIFAYVQIPIAVIKLFIKEEFLVMSKSVQNAEVQ